MNIPFSNISRQYQELNDEVQSALISVMGSGHFILGRCVNDFEKSYAKYIGTKYCVACANGTDALEMVLETIDLKPGDEVIIPAFGWVSVYTAVVRIGAKPVFVDVTSDGLIDFDLVEGAINKKTKAIIPIHLFGKPVEIMKIRDLCDDRGLYLIEDCAQAHGARVNKKAVGSFGHFSIFSFYPTKNLGAYGDGGAILTDNSEYAKKLASLGNYGKISRSSYSFAGRNSRLDEIQASMLSLKLKYLDTWNLKRRAIAKRYSEALNLSASFSADSVYHQFTICVKDRENFIRTMSKEGVECDIHYPFTISGSFGLSSPPVAKQLSNHIVSLPLYPELSELEISYICDRLILLQDHLL